MCLLLINWKWRDFWVCSAVGRIRNGDCVDLPLIRMLTFGECVWFGYVNWFGYCNFMIVFGLVFSICSTPWSGFPIVLMYSKPQERFVWGNLNPKNSVLLMFFVVESKWSLFKKIWISMRIFSLFWCNWIQVRFFLKKSERSRRGFPVIWCNQTQWKDLHMVEPN